jgi:hypothetical protein
LVFAEAVVAEVVAVMVTGVAEGIVDGIIVDGATVEEIMEGVVVEEVVAEETVEEESAVATGVDTLAGITVAVEVAVQVAAAIARVGLLRSFTFVSSNMRRSLYVPGFYRASLYPRNIYVTHTTRTTTMAT